MIKEILKNKEYYEKAYKSGYGVMYPESHVIRWYERILKYELNIDGSKNERLLDFGCGNGTHAMFFKSKNFRVYGMDVDKGAIGMAKMRMGSIRNNFFTIDPDGDITKLVNFKFNVIFSNQTLYFLDNKQLKKILYMFDSMLEKDGIVFFSMMSSKHYLNRFTTRRFSNGLSKMELKGRLNGELYINITNSENELKDRFSLFKPLYTGYYDSCLLKGDLRHHYVFTGKKR